MPFPGHLSLDAPENFAAREPTPFDVEYLWRGRGGKIGYVYLSCARPRSELFYNFFTLISLFSRQAHVLEPAAVFDLRPLLARRYSPLLPITPRKFLGYY